MASWYATGKLQPLWQRYGKPPYQREQLAKSVGSSPSVLSQINTGGRKLGIDLAQRLADELGVTLLDLGKPADQEIVADLLVLDRLAKLEAQGARQAKMIRDLTRRLTKAEERLAAALPQPDTQTQARDGQ